MAYVKPIKPGRKLRLRDIDPEQDGGLSREEGERKTAKLAAELDKLDDLLDYANQHALLIVLQGRDAAGKDGLLRHLFGNINAASARVETFKQPTEEELGHDFLWRVHRKAPQRGELVVFNRSHYEDVLVVRVHDLVAKPVWKGRFEHINNFERLLVDSGTIVLKFFLHVSKHEQERRLLAREEETEKAWKLAVGDWKEREHWDAYTEAYEEALSRCSTPWAPWYVIPADRKWFRDLAVTEVLVAALAAHRKAWLGTLARVGKQAKTELLEYRNQRDR